MKITTRLELMMARQKIRWIARQAKHGNRSISPAKMILLSNRALGRIHDKTRREQALLTRKRHVGIDAQNEPYKIVDGTRIFPVTYRDIYKSLYYVCKYLTRAIKKLDTISLSIRHS